MNLEELKKHPACYYHTNNGVLLCGDCLELMKAISDSLLDMCLTDPPYGLTACKWDSIIPLESMWKQLKRIIKSNGAIVMTASQPFTTTLISSNMKMFKYEMVFKKRPVGHLLAKIRPMQGHENILIFCKSKEKYNPQMIKRTKEELSRMGKMNCLSKGDKIKTERALNIKHVKKDNYKYKFPNTWIKIQLDQLQKIQHPTQKPVALMEYLIKTYTNEGEMVLDFAIGSGTTAVAAEKLNRRWIGIEISEEYCEMAKKRIELEVKRPKISKLKKKEMKIKRFSEL